MTRRAALLLLLASALACALQPGTPHRGVRVVVARAGAQRPATGVPVVFAEIAATEEARRRGLGGRDRLDADAGMLFVYSIAEDRVYWMKDCLIGLDIAFIGEDERILNVATLPRGVGRSVEDMPKARSERPARWVLETRAGWFDAHGVTAGDEVDLRPALSGVDRR